MGKTFMLIASILGAIGVCIGAFGAHAFKDFLVETNRLNTFETGVKYHFIHTLSLLAISILSLSHSSSMLNFAGWFAILGIIFFSGSIYAICWTQISKLGMITPLGGLFFIISWVLIGVFAYQIK